MSLRALLRFVRASGAVTLGFLAAAAGFSATAQEPRPARLEQMAPLERQDFGVPPTRQLHAGAMHGPTPASLPGGQLITTQGLVALQGRSVPFVVFDVLGQASRLPNAVPAAWLAQPGSFDDAVQQQAGRLFDQATGGRKDTALVFYCLSRECWMSYNAALRALAAGYKNVLWYRGGLEAWQYAGLPVQAQQQAQPAQTAQQAPQTAAAPPRPQPAGEGLARFVPVQPVVRGANGPGAAPPQGDLQIGQGRHFSFALPPGWRVGEDGAFALTLVAPDNRAMTIMVGNAGMPLNHAPARFVHDKLSAIAAQNLQIGAPRPARPAAGFRQAVEFDIGFTGQRGVPYRGVAKVSVAPAYDSATMAMTAAIAPADQWNGYAAWLPQVADQVSATNGAAFGMRGIMQQNLQNSVAYGEAARQYRDWSQRNWQGVTDARNASQDRRNFAVRENLGGVQTFASPYAAGQAYELPMSHRYYWTDGQGRFVGTDDPAANPNAGSTGEWRRMERVTR